MVRRACASADVFVGAAALAPPKSTCCECASCSHKVAKLGPEVRVRQSPDMRPSKSHTRADHEVRDGDKQQDDGEYPSGTHSGGQVSARELRLEVDGIAAVIRAILHRRNGLCRLFRHVTLKHKVDLPLILRTGAGIEVAPKRIALACSGTLVPRDNPTCFWVTFVKQAPYRCPCSKNLAIGSAAYPSFRQWVFARAWILVVASRRFPPCLDCHSILIRVCPEFRQAVLLCLATHVCVVRVPDVVIDHVVSRVTQTREIERVLRLRLQVGVCVLAFVCTNHVSRCHKQQFRVTWHIAGIWRTCGAPNQPTGEHGIGLAEVATYTKGRTGCCPLPQTQSQPPQQLRRS